MITSKFELLVHDNGQWIEIKKVIKENEGLEELLMNCSARVAQSLTLYMEMKKGIKEGKSIEEAYNTAIANTANKYRITTSSVTDKVTRQQKLTAEKVRNMIYEDIVTGSNFFRSKLYQNVGKNTISYDKKAIDIVLG